MYQAISDHIFLNYIKQNTELSCLEIPDIPQNSNKAILINMGRCCRMN